MTVHHRLAAAAVLALVTTPGRAPADILKYDASGTSPTAPTNGSGPWGGPAAVWSNGTADVPWADGSSADIGDARGTATYTLTLVGNVATAGITVTGPGTGASGYTFNAAGYTLSSAGADVQVTSAPVTLTNGTFVVGATATPYQVSVGGGGSLTVGPAATLVTSSVAGDSAAATVTFAGGSRLRATNADFSAAGTDSVLLGGTTRASIGGNASSGGLTVDTSPIGANATASIVDPLVHLTTVATADGGLTKTGAGTLALLGASTYTGPTVVNGGTLSLGAANAAGGTVADGAYTVNAGGTLLVAAPNAVLGTTPATSAAAITVNAGGFLTTADHLSVPVGNLTLAGGTLTSGAPSVTPAGNAGSFELNTGTVLHVTANSTMDAAFMVLDGGSNVRIDAAATLAVPGTFSDKYPGTGGVVPTALTLIGPGSGTGTVDLQAYQAYTGNTSVTKGVLLLLDVANPPVGTVSAGTINVLSGGTVRVAAANALLGNAGFGTYTGAAVKVSSGGTLATAAGVSTTAGNVTLFGGVLAAAAPLGPDGSFDFVNGSTLTVTANSTASAAGMVLLPSAQVNVAAGTLTVTGSFGNATTSGLTGTLTKAGPGTLTLSAANPYSGPTNVSAGMVNLTATGSLTGTSALTVAAGATFNAAGPVTSGPATAVNGTATFAGLTTLGTLAVGPAAQVAVATAASPAVRNTLVTTGLSIAPGGQFDLSDDDLVVHNTTPSAVAALLGNGLTSSAAAANPARNTAVGVIRAVGTTFDTVPVSPADVLAKYTYYGDANLDGVVDGADYGRIDAGYNSNGALTGWYNGDFNYDGRVDGSDYTLIDNAFNTQAGSYAPNALIPNALLATATAEVAVAVPEPATVGALGLGLMVARRRPRRSAGR